MMPAGAAKPRMTLALIALMSIALFIASRTRASAKGFLPFTSLYFSSGEPTSRPKKIERTCAVSSVFRPAVALMRPISCSGASSRKSIWPEIRAATRVEGSLIGV